MLYSISIKTMAPQSAVIAWDLSCEGEEGGRGRMHVCMPLWMAACMCACMPLCTHAAKWGKRKRLFVLFHKNVSRWDGGKKITKNIFQTHPDAQPYTYTGGCVCLQRTCRSLKAKHPERQRKKETCKCIYMFPGGVWCYALFSNSSWRQRGSSPRWFNTKLPPTMNGQRKSPGYQLHASDKLC